MKLKQKMTRLGGMIKNIETLDFNQQQTSPMNNSNAMAMVNKNIDPNRRETTRRNLGMFFGHENWNLIMNMMIGFRAGLKGLLQKDLLVDLDYQHVVRHDVCKVTFNSKFEAKEKFIMCDYAPYVFDDIRRMIGVEREDYQRALGPENILGNLLMGYLNSMTELGAQGGSGALFYLTPDSQFFVKTIRKEEFDVAFGTLKQYHEHLKRNINSLIYKVTGLYSVETFIGGKPKTLYICILKNIFSELKADKVFDLKGSTHGRSSRKGKKISNVLKDLDWMDDKLKWKLEKGLQSYISQVIDSDVGFLQSINVMDYSLLLGIHEIKGNPDDYLRNLARPIDGEVKYPNGAKKAIHNVFRGGVISHDRSCIYMFAIIDIYTFYNGTKKAENFFKTIVYGSGVSAVSPDIYGARFKAFMNKQYG